MQLINQVSQAEHDPKAEESGSYSVQGNIHKVLEEFLLLQVVPTREDHGWQQGVEEDLFVELVLR